MSELIHQDVKELLDELNELGVAIIFGGYLRSRIFNQTPNDVDIVTNIPISVLEEKYGHLEKAKARITTSGQNVFAFKMHRTEKIFVEIVSTKDDLFDKAHKADYTINSMMYDGIKVIDLKNAQKDLREKTIREVSADIIREDLKTRPYLWLKTIRLVSSLGFKLSDTTFEIMEENKWRVENVSEEIMQTEGHKTLNGKNPFLAMKFLSMMGVIAPFEVSEKFKEKEFSIQTQQKLCLLAVLSSKEIVDEFCEFYYFQQDLIDKYHKLYDFYYSEERVPSRFRHQIQTIRKLIEE